MKGLVGGKLYRVDAKDRLDGGGEGTIYAFDSGRVLKVYHKPTLERADKLRTMVGHLVVSHTCRIMQPQETFTDADTNLISGYVMERLGAGYEDLAQLAIKKYQNQFNVPTREIALMFLNMHDALQDIHRAGYCIGDFNDTNEKFQGHSVAFMDVDSWQFGKFPGPVATESFLTPRLYGIDLASGPHFRPEDDWYSFTVMFFKLLLRTHPYGGTHPTVKTLLQQKRQRITVLDADVIYPEIALPPSLLSDDLTQTFMSILKDGKSGIFPRQEIEHYVADLVECPKCGITYPRERHACPMCQNIQMIPVTPIARGISTQELFSIPGTIIYSKLIEGTLYAIAHYQGTASLYAWSPLHALGYHILGDYVPGTRYAMLGDQLIVNPPYSPHLNMTLGILKTTLDTDIYSVSRSAMFRTSSSQLFRIAGGQLMAGEFKFGQYSERSIRPVSLGQTWFAVRDEAGARPTVCGFTQINSAQRWWLSWEGMLYDGLDMTPFNLGEFQTDVLVRFDRHGAIVLRATQEAGVEYLHLALINPQGGVTNEPRVKRNGALPHGAAYANGALVIPTDEGLVQRKRFTDRTFDQTKGVVHSGDTLYSYGSDLLIIQQHRVLLLRFR